MKQTSALQGVRPRTGSSQPGPGSPGSPSVENKVPVQGWGGAGLTRLGFVTSGLSSLPVAEERDCFQTQTLCRVWKEGLNSDPHASQQQCWILSKPPGKTEPQWGKELPLFLDFAPESPVRGGGFTGEQHHPRTCSGGGGNQLTGVSTCDDATLGLTRRLQRGGLLAQKLLSAELPRLSPTT